MRGTVWLVALPLVPLAILLPFFPEKLPFPVLPWPLRLLLVLVASALAGALAARLDRATPPFRVGAAAALPATIVGVALGVMTAMAPAHLLLVALSGVALLASGIAGAAATTPLEEPR